MKKPVRSTKTASTASASKKSRKPSGSRRKPIMRHSREGVKSKSGKAGKARKAKKKGAAGGGRASRASDSPKRRYLDAFRREMPVTLRIMRALPAGAGDFKPHERSGTAIRLIHTFFFENSAVTRATTQDLQFPPNFPGPPATLAEAIDNYERGAKEVIAAVEAMPESRLSEKVTFFTGPGQMGEIPVIDMFWFMLMDSIHHRGQLSVYVRLAGGKVPSVYGPTADEPWR